MTSVVSDGGDAPALAAVEFHAPPTRSWLSEGILLAIVPALVYTVAYRYEMGFAEGLGYPKEFITLSLETLAATIPALLVLYAGAAFSVLMIPPVLFLALVRILLPVWLAWSLLGGNKWQGLEWVGWLMFGFVMLANLLDVLMVVSVVRDPTLEFKKPTLRQLYEGRGVLMNPVVTSALGMGSPPRPRTTLLLLVLIVGVTLSPSLGRTTARNTQKFLVRHGTPELVALRRYGDYFVCATLDRAGRRMLPRFTAVHVVADSVASWQLETRGSVTLPPTARP